MPEITINNTDWSIISAIKDALQSATVGGLSFFSEVELCLSSKELSDKKLTAAGARAIVRYEATDECEGLDGEVECVLRAEITAIDKISQSTESSARIQRALELKNGLINAVEQAGISQASGSAGGGDYNPQIKWGKAKITVTDEHGPPWVICTIPLNIAYCIQSKTSH